MNTDEIFDQIIVLTKQITELEKEREQLRIKLADSINKATQAEFFPSTKVVGNPRSAAAPEKKKRNFTKKSPDPSDTRVQCASTYTMPPSGLPRLKELQAFFEANPTGYYARMTVAGALHRGFTETDALLKNLVRKKVLTAHKGCSPNSNRTVAAFKLAPLKEELKEEKLKEEKVTPKYNTPINKWTEAAVRDLVISVLKAHPEGLHARKMEIPVALSTLRRVLNGMKTDKLVTVEIKSRTGHPGGSPVHIYRLKG